MVWILNMGLFDVKGEDLNNEFWKIYSVAGEYGPFIDFMLDKILRTLKAKGKAYEDAAIERSSQKIMGW